MLQVSLRCGMAFYQQYIMPSQLLSVIRDTRRPKQYNYGLQGSVWVALPLDCVQACLSEGEKGGDRVIVAGGKNQLNIHLSELILISESLFWFPALLTDWLLWQHQLSSGQYNTTNSRKACNETTHPHLHTHTHTHTHSHTP